MSYLDDLMLNSVSTERRTYFYRFIDEDVWYRYVANHEIEWEFWETCDEAVELMPDGTGRYVRCKQHPIKESCFSKLPDTMMIIALSAATVKSI